MKPAHPRPVIHPELLTRFDKPGPRYTSYPTADRFVEAFGEHDYLQALQQRRNMGTGTPLSIYAHIPFCASLCYYCACNKIVTKRTEKAGQYLQYLLREIGMHADALGPQQKVSQIHFGGGTPTFMDDDQLKAILDALRSHFQLMPGSEMSIEIDPRTVDRDRLRLLAAMGFNRISLGVQDFDAEVQKAVHRIQPVAQVADLVEAARAIGFRSVNVDLIYGLPRQTRQSFRQTLAQVTALRPHRIALYGYAHLPERFKPQRRIEAAELPAAGDKVGMLSDAITHFIGAGYVYIGMDHFALPDDALAIAKRQGLLHRNFQGYSTQPDCDLLGLGVSAIGRIGATYSQNAKTLEEYYDQLDQGRFPVVRGLALQHDDLVRRAVIMALMCQGHVQFDSVELAYLIDFRQYFAQELQSMAGFARDGLVELENGSLQVTAKGWFFVRGIAMAFDRYLQADRNRARFSRMI